MNVDRGFVAERTLLVPLSMPGNRYDGERVRQDAYDHLIAAMHALPGVTSATTMSALPLSGSTQLNTVSPEGSPLARSEQPSANFRFVGPEFFRTLGIPVRRGFPKGVGGLAEVVRSPTFSTAVGLVVVGSHRSSIFRPAQVTR